MRKNHTLPLYIAPQARKFYHFYPCIYRCRQENVNILPLYLAPQARFFYHFTLVYSAADEEIFNILPLYIAPQARQFWQLIGYIQGIYIDF